MIVIASPSLKCVCSLNDLLFLLLFQYPQVVNTPPAKKRPLDSSDASHQDQQHSHLSKKMRESLALNRPAPDSDSESDFNDGGGDDEVEEGYPHRLQVRCFCVCTVEYRIGDDRINDIYRVNDDLPALADQNALFYYINVTKLTIFSELAMTLPPPRYSVN
jgi:hypothetical protein